MTYPMAFSTVFNLYRLLFSIKKEIYKGNALMLLFALTGKKKVSILLADDDDDDRDIFIQVMKEISEGADIKSAKTGLEVLELLNGSAYRPDVIFLDLNMPVMGGYECLKQLKADKELKRIPIIIYSTSSNQLHIQETFDSGANLYIPKPDSYTGLRKMAQQVLSLNLNEYINPVRDKFLLRF